MRLLPKMANAASPEVVLVASLAAPFLRRFLVYHGFGPGAAGPQRALAA